MLLKYSQQMPHTSCNETEQEEAEKEEELISHCCKSPVDYTILLF